MPLSTRSGNSIVNNSEFLDLNFPKVFTVNNEINTLLKKARYNKAKFYDKRRKKERKYLSFEKAECSVGYTWPKLKFAVINWNYDNI